MTVPCIMARAIALYCLLIVVWSVCIRIPHRVLYDSKGILCPRLLFWNAHFVYSSIYSILYTHQNELKSILLNFTSQDIQVLPCPCTPDGFPRAVPRYQPTLVRRPPQNIRMSGSHSGGRIMVNIWESGVLLKTLGTRNEYLLRVAGRSRVCSDSFLLRR